MTTDEQAKRIAEPEAQLADENRLEPMRALDAALSQVVVLRAAAEAMRKSFSPTGSAFSEVTYYARHFANCSGGGIACACGFTQANATHEAGKAALLAALASTQATADAYRASIRREALEDATTACLEVAAVADGDDPFHSGATCCVDRIRALATRGTP